LDKRLKAIREYYGKLIDEAKDYGRSKEEIDALAANRDQALFEENVKEVGKFVNTAGDLYSQFTQLQEMEFNNQKTALDNKLAQGLISEEQYNAELADIEKKQFEQNKKTQKANVLINSASAIVRAFSELGPIGGAIAAFAIGAMAIKQMSLIDSAQFPEGFKEGVIDLNGPGTGTSDSIPARLSRGESVMTADETKRYKPVLQAIRDNNFEEFVSKRYIDAMSGTKRSFADNVGASIELNNFEMIDAIRKNKSVKIANWDDFDKVLRKPRTAHKVHRRRAW
jgi:nucleoid DNA-binding protein